MNRVPKKEAAVNERKRRMEEMMEADPGREARLATIQMLIPLGLKAVEEELAREIAELSGQRYTRGKKMGYWGSNPGSVYLADQKVRIKVPRIRRKDTNEEVPLMSYVRLQSPQMMDEMALRRVVNGISCKKYEGAVLSVPETFGIKRGSISRRWIRASSKKLRAMLERDLSGYDIVGIIVDGKVFGENEVIFAMGVTISGEKVILGFIEASSENAAVCRDFMNSLIARGLRLDNEILFVLDGAKGLRKGVVQVFGDKAVMARCQWHKRENVVEYLNKNDKVEYRRRLQAAYEQPDYEEAKRRLDEIKKDLRVLNESAVKSLEEGLEETLTLHRLRMFDKIGESFKTTNCLENLNRQLGIYTDRVCRWKTSHQRQRWVATALSEIEPCFKKVKGYRYLPQLREAMKRMVNQKSQARNYNAA
jgi:transposase-like protein